MKYGKFQMDDLLFFILCVMALGALLLAITIIFQPQLPQE